MDSFNCFSEIIYSFSFNLILSLDFFFASSNASSKVNIRSLVITLVCSIKLNFKGNKEDL